MKASYHFNIHTIDKDGSGLPIAKAHYLKSYAELFAYAQTQGIELSMTIGDTYMGSGMFSRGWTFENQALVPITRSIHADAILLKTYDRPATLESTFPQINPQFIFELASDKWKTYELFHELMPLTLDLGAESMETVIETIQTSKIVYKPKTGNGGEGIYVVPRTAGFPDQIGHKIKSYIAQSFVDMRNGVKGLVSGTHDVRVLMGTSGPVAGIVRSAPPGGHTANLAQGGSARALTLTQIPQAALKIAEEVDSTLSVHGPRFYSIDCIFENDTAYLCEINAQPGIPNADTYGSDFCVTFYQALLDALKKSCDVQ